MQQYETSISRNNLEQIQRPNMTPSELIDFLNTGALYRPFSAVLQEVYPFDDLADRLRTRLLSMTDGENSKKETDSIRKNVANWLRGDAIPQNREQLFRICFALELSEADASRVLARASETGIHYRNPKELVYAYAFRTGMNYREAVALNREMEAIYLPVIRDAEARLIAQWKVREKTYREMRAEAARRQRENGKKGLWNDSYVGNLLEEEPPNFWTQQMVHQFEKISSKEQLRHFFAEHSADLGVIHESAYEKFWKLLLTLQEPDDAIISGDESGSDVYSLDTIVQKYLRMHVPVDRKTGRYGYLQKAIKKNWPDTTELQKMKNRRIDVSRKVLLLLFLITEDFLFSEDLQYSDSAEKDAAWYLPDEEETPRDQLEIQLSKLNLFLETYGMNQLDPGNPFDCLVLYALAADYGTGFLSDKCNNALEVLFPESEQ